MQQLDDRQSLVVELAFAIEDPCGDDELKLARALIEFGRSMRAEDRPAATEFLLNLAKVWRR